MEYALIIERWLHITAGILWVGMLYYFNFVQIPADITGLARLTHQRCIAHSAAVLHGCPEPRWFLRGSQRVFQLLPLSQQIARISV